jgi:DNA-binding transcriptional regulator LsrR (DeoR family)
MQSFPDLRIITKAARLYHEERLTQTEIAGRLGISQVAVSRLLKRAGEYGIVRTTVISPPGAFAELEGLLEQRFGLNQAVIAEAARDAEEAVLNAIGSAAALLLETTLKSGDVIGISSWSASLLSMVDQMHPVRKIQKCTVVQMLGGIGSPSAEKHANHLATRLARLVHGDARFLAAPGVVGSTGAAKILSQDPYVRETLEFFDKITVAAVGIGSVEPSALVASSGNRFSSEELGIMLQNGAVGDICLRFYDAEGRDVKAPLGNRVIGIDLERLRRIRTTIGIAGGKRKLAAILGGLRGKWINTLVTDQYTADRLDRHSGKEQN